MLETLTVANMSLNNTRIVILWYLVDVILVN